MGFWPNAPTTADGVKIALSEEQIFMLKEYASVPCWHVCVEGPVPLGLTDRFGMTFDYIVRETKDEVLQLVYGAINAQCDASGITFDADEWDITHCVMCNCC